MQCSGMSDLIGDRGIGEARRLLGERSDGRRRAVDATCVIEDHITRLACSL
jgi:hypothetical protein